MDLKADLERWKLKVKAAMVANIEGLCRHYLGNGRKMGNMWHVGCPQNSQGDSLKIYLSGPKQGLAYWNRQDKGLDVLSLWQEIHRQPDFVTALDTAADWCGMLAEKPRFEPGRSAVRRAPLERLQEVKQPTAMARDMINPPAVFVAPTDYKPVQEGSRAWRYLVEDTGIPGDVLKRAGIGEGRVWMPVPEGFENMQDVWVVPIVVSGVVRNVKYICLERFEVEKKGEKVREKVVRSAKGGEYHLIGMDLIDLDAVSEVVICEGERDWLCALAEGKVAVSVPYGAKWDSDTGEPNAGNKWIENDWEWLERVPAVVLAFDHDDPGRKAVATLLRRLPKNQLKRVALITDVWPDAPEKADVTDLYQRDPELVHLLIDGAREDEPEALGRASDFRERIYKKMFRLEGEAAEGYEVHNLGNNLRWRCPEWTIVTGYEKSGKTTWLSHQIVDLCSQGLRACVASMENNPWETYYTMFRQAMGVMRPLKLPDAEPDVDRFNRCVQWMDDHVLCYGGSGMVDLEELLELFAYCARRYGCRFFVIDNLMMLKVKFGKDQTSVDREKIVGDLLKRFVDEYQCHLFLVAHAKKVQEEKGQFRKPVRPQDVRGGGELVNLAFNIIGIHLNDEKLHKIRDISEGLRLMEDDARRNGGRIDLEKMMKLKENLREWEDKHDSVMFVLGQRNADGDTPKPARCLYFLPESRQLWHERDMASKVYVQ